VSEVLQLEQSPCYLFGPQWLVRVGETRGTSTEPYGLAPLVSRYGDNTAARILDRKYVALHVFEFYLYLGQPCTQLTSFHLKFGPPLIRRRRCIWRRWLSSDS